MAAGAETGVTVGALISDVPAAAAVIAARSACPLKDHPQLLPRFFKATTTVCVVGPTFGEDSAQFTSSADSVIIFSCRVAIVGEKQTVVLGATGFVEERAGKRAARRHLHEDMSQDPRPSCPAWRFGPPPPSARGLPDWPPPRG